MPRIAVFDSGLGSLSVVRELQKTGKKAEIIYFADTKSYPYGSKSKAQMRRIIDDTITRLKKRFEPDVVIIASNTPTMVLDIKDGYHDGMLVIGVRPLLAQAIESSQTGKIGVLGTASGIKSDGLLRMIRQHSLPRRTIYRINASDLVDAVESGLFLTDALQCRTRIRNILTPVICRHNIDVVTLSSTHLPFLSHMLQAEHPAVRFIDPARHIAQMAFEVLRKEPNDTNSLKIYASGMSRILQENLTRLGVNRVVRQF